MKHLLLALAATATLTTGCAQAGRLLDVNVQDRTTGEQLPVYRHYGKWYVAGTPGNKYGITVRNQTGGRLLAVVSVDGVNVITGETASPEQSGYVLNPQEYSEINGWLKSMNQIATFVFSSASASYAAKTGRPDHVGVIGVAVFEERRRYPKYSPAPRLGRAEEPAAKAESRADSAPAAAAPQGSGTARAPSSPPADTGIVQEKKQRLGTGHGERESTETSYTDFTRAGTAPSEVITIYYDSYANLVAKGVIPRRPASGNPDPFPGGKFVPDPRW